MTTFFIFVIMLLSHCNISLQYTTMKVTLKNDGDNYICTETCFGTPEQCMDLRIDFQSFYVWIFNTTSSIPSSFHSFNQLNSSTLKELYLDNNRRINITYSTFEVSGFGVQDKFEIQNALDISDFNFVLIDTINSNPKSEGMLGLGFIPSNEEEETFSFVEQLYLQKKISHKVFGIEFSSHKTTQLFFGDVPNEIVRDYYHYGTCKVIRNITNNNNNWQCYLDNIRLTRTYQTITEKIPVVFSLNTTNLYMPYHLLPKIEKEYSKLIDDGRCWFDYDNVISVTSLYCSIASKLPTLVFDFDTWRMNLPERLLKTKSYFHYYKMMSFKEGQESIIFSLDILKYFILVFDKDNEQIGFYNSDYIRYIGTSPLQKPNYEGRIESSIEHKQYYHDLYYREKVPKTLFGFIGGSVITVMIALVLVFRMKREKFEYEGGNKSNKNRGRNKINVISHGNRMEEAIELEDIDIRNVLKEKALVG